MVKAFACVKGFALALLLTAADGPTAWTKPPDLPVEAEYICLPTGAEFPAQTEPPIVETHGRDYFIEVGTENPVRYHCVPNGSAFNCVELINGFWDDLVAMLNGSVFDFSGVKCQNTCLLPLPLVSVTGNDFGDAMQQLGEARNFYEQAEQCFQTGDLPSAHHFFQETHLKSPNSRYGQVARERLTQIETMMAQAALACQKAQVAQCNHGVGCAPIPACTRTPTDGERFLQNLAQAQEMFRVAESCRRRGDLDKAFTCYHETRRLCPSSDYAEQASTEIRRIEALRQVQDDSEVTEENTPDQASQLDLQMIPVAISVLMDLFGFSPCETQEVEPIRCRPYYTQGARAIPCLGALDISSCYRLRPLATYVDEAPDAEVSTYIDSIRTSSQNSVDVSAVMTTVLSVLGGNPQVEVDFDTSRQEGIRFLGGIYYGAFGCRVTVDGDSFRVELPTYRGSR